jgi:hypothetical protein
MTPEPTDLYTGALIDAAEKHAEAYDGDDRECIKTDVLNAFYAGAAWNAKHGEHQARISELEQALFYTQCQVVDLERDA